MRVPTRGAGYKVVTLWSGVRSRSFTVHRLVAIHFVAGRARGLQVNHVDANKQNNRSGNLEWVTKSQNIKHSYRCGRIHGGGIGLPGSDNPVAKLTETQVLTIRKQAPNKTYKALAKAFSVSPSAIAHIVTRSTWKHVA